MAVGLTSDDLFDLLTIRDEDIPIVSDEQLEEAKELIEDWGDHYGLRLLGATEEDLAAGAHAYLDGLAEENNNDAKQRFSDAVFLSRRGQRIFKDVAQTAAILIDNNSTNRSLIAAWLLTPNLRCEGERPIDRLKSDPIQVLAMAHGLIFDDDGKIPESYGQML